MQTTIKFKRPSDEDTEVSTSNAESLAYGEPGWCPVNRVLYIGTEDTAAQYGKFLSEGEDSSYMPVTHPANNIDASKINNWDAAYTYANGSHTLTALDDVASVIPSQDGHLLSYNNSAGNFQWVAPTTNTDNDVSTTNLSSRLAQLTGTINIGVDGTTTTIIKGNLQVEGDTTTLSTSTLDVEDVNITLAKGSTSPASSSIAGITIDGTDANFGTGTEARFYYAHNTNFPFGSSGTTETFAINRPLQIVDSGGISKLEIVSSTGNAELLMNKVGSGTWTVITNGNWTGNNLTENQITGANFTDWDAAYTHSQAAHAPANATAGADWNSNLSNIPSDIVYDSDFSSDGILQRDSAGTYSTLPYLGGLNLKGLHNSATPAGTPGQLLTSQGSGGFSWSTVGSGSGEIAAGDHTHTLIDGGNF